MATASKNVELRMRIVSALVLAVVAFGEVWAGGGLFSVFVSAVALIVFLEWTAIIGLSAFAKARLSAIVLMIVPLATLILLGVRASLAALLVCALAAYFFTVSTTKGTANWTAGAVLYCGLAAISLVSLRSDEQGISLILLLFAIVWGTDIGAYFVGRKLGGTKLAPKISPGKTRSGAVGGLVIAMGCAAILAAATGVLDPFVALLLASVISIVSQAGDLFESYIKRNFGVKDSGTIMPGHGGLFDRVDGLMPAAIAMFVIFNFL